MSKSPKKTTSTQRVELPAWLDTAWQNITNQTMQYGQQQTPGYTGQLTAGMNGTQQQAIGAVQGLPSSVQTGTVADADMSKYMNPYEDAVIDASMNDLNRQTEIANMRARSGAATAGAYGSSRASVLEAENERAAMDAAARTSAQLRQQGYSQAQTLAGQDIDRTYAAGLNNAQLGLTRANALMQAGTMQQQTEQAGMTAQYQEWLRQQQDEADRLNMQIGALGASPYNNNATMTGPGGASTGSQLMQLGGTLGSAYIMSLSDKRAKEDIKKVGELDNGLPVFAFRYKDGGPVQIGLMAQDVEKVRPGAVHERGGFKFVDYKAAVK